MTQDGCFRRTSLSFPASLKEVPTTDNRWRRPSYNGLRSALRRNSVVCRANIKGTPAYTSALFSGRCILNTFQRWRVKSSSDITHHRCRVSGKGLGKDAGRHAAAETQDPARTPTVAADARPQSRRVHVVLSSPFFFFYSSFFKLVFSRPFKMMAEKEN